MKLQTVSFQNDITQEWIIAVLTESCQLLQRVDDQLLRCLQEDAAVTKQTGSTEDASPCMATVVYLMLYMYMNTYCQALIFQEAKRGVN